MTHAAIVVSLFGLSWLQPDSPTGGESEPATRTIQVGPMSLDVPADWTSKQPSSPMRLAEIVVPVAAEGAEPLTIVAYHFPQQGGDVDSNVQRWFGQFERPEGESPETVQKREDLKTGDITVTLVQTRGAYRDRGPMMSGPGTVRPDFMLLGAIIPSNQGPYFFKCVGPAGDLEKQRDRFREAMLSIRFAAG